LFFRCHFDRFVADEAEILVPELFDGVAGSGRQIPKVGHNRYPTDDECREHSDDSGEHRLIPHLAAQLEPRDGDYQSVSNNSSDEFHVFIFFEHVRLAIQFLPDKFLW
jgi:hypothetical protein